MKEHDYEIEASLDSIRIRFAPGTRLELEMARQAFSSMLGICQGKCLRVLWDMTCCTPGDGFTCGAVFFELRGHERRWASSSGIRRVAVVADNDAGYGVARMFELLSGNLPIGIAIFRDASPAQQWLAQSTGSTDDV